MLEIYLTDSQVGRFLGVDLVHQCADPDTIRSLSKSGVKHTIGGLGAHLA